MAGHGYVDQIVFDSAVQAGLRVQESCITVMEWMIEVLVLIANGVLTSASGIGCVHRLEYSSVWGLDQSALAAFVYLSPSSHARERESALLSVAAVFPEISLY